MTMRIRESIDPNGISAAAAARKYQRYGLTDQDADNNGNVTIRKCYMHHSDIPRANIRIDGGSNSTETHIVEDNYLNTGQGIFSDAEYITVQRNIVQGWPYWGHLASNGT